MTEDAATRLKRAAAERAVADIENGMAVGLGTGSTSALAVEALAERMRHETLRIVGVPTSEKTAAQAASLGIPLTDLAKNPSLDLTIDGADAVQRGTLSLIKGLGGALLREKIVATSSKRMNVIVDDSKLRGPIGSFCPVPVEVSQFGWQATQLKLAALEAAAELRMSSSSGEPFVTDGGNFIIDCNFGEIADAAGLEERLCRIAGVIETGLFVGIATIVIVASPGGINILERD